jgi:hypothetical protein
MLKFTTYCVLPKTDFRFIIFEMGKLEDRVKLTMNFLAKFCAELFPFISKIYFG